MRVDTKPVETGIIRTSGKSGEIVFQTNLHYLDLGDILIHLKKKKATKKHPKKKKQLAAKVSEHMYDSWPFQLKPQF